MVSYQPRYQPGDRVELIHTSDPHTRLRPGDTGTRYHLTQNWLDVAWDTGSHLTMLLNEGDQVCRLP
jgi:Domain of unknown function (DUF4314)